MGDYPVTPAKVGQRIRSARKDAKLTQMQVANIIGVRDSTIQRYETGSINRIKLPVIAAIANALGVNPGWLVFKSDEKYLPLVQGGTVFTDTHLAANPAQAAQNAEYQALKDDSLISPDGTVNQDKLEQHLSKPELPHRDLLPIRRKRVPFLGKIAAGEPMYAEQEHESYVLADDDINCDFALRACGDSMINARINDGDVVFIRNQPDVDDGEIAAVIIDDSATLKRVRKIDGGLMLMSDNPKYKPMLYTNANCDSLRILGKAVAFQSGL